MSFARITDANTPKPEPVFYLVAADAPFLHVATANEAADATLCVAKRRSLSVTGQNLIVEGGTVFG